MRLTIVPEDQIVYVDRVGKSPLDLSLCAVPAGVHALQWNETAGWIEFVDNPDGTKPQNQPITELPAWANCCVAKWQDAAPVNE